MKTIQIPKRTVPVMSILLIACGQMDRSTENVASQKIQFDTLLISNNANQWFARALEDLNEDGLLDVVFINQAGFGGELGVLIGSREAGWEIDWIAETAPNGGVFSCGDIELADIDGDGKTDILGPQNNGEWTDKPKKHTFYWYSWPEKEAHYIGTSKMYIKDVSVVDLNNDSKPDLAGISFDGSYVIVYEQIAPDEWRTVQNIEAKNIHEGMDVGDIDGDGYIDIAANGYWVRNPDGDMDGEWNILPIDTTWHNQTGDWSRNATKHYCADIDADGRSEVLISHSERDGYPVACYSLTDAKENIWEKKIIIDNLPAAHTLQVADMDGDGDLDVVTGVNKNRARDIGINNWPLYVVINQGDGIWEKQLIDKRGIYNGHVGDFDGDGDMDIFRLISHDDKRYELLINLVNK